jgi:hypothetical protein
VLGHKLVVRTPAAQENMHNVVSAFNKYWMAGGSSGGPR